MASTTAAAIGVGTILVWEATARYTRTKRLVPPLWLVGLFCAAPAVAFTLGGGFHLGNSGLSCLVFGGLALAILVLDARDHGKRTIRP